MSTRPTSSPLDAMRAAKQGTLPDWALMRALVSHRAWQVPADAAPAGPDAAPTPRLSRSDDGVRLAAWAEPATFAAAHASGGRAATFTGAGLFGLLGALGDGLAEVVLEPGGDAEIRFGTERFGALRHWAEVDRITRIVRGLDDAPDAFDRLRRFDGWHVFERETDDGRQLLRAPDARGRALVAVFTAEDTLHSFLARFGERLRGQPIELVRSDGQALFERLAATPGLDGIVFDCAGPLPPKAVRAQFAREVLAAPPPARAAALARAQRIAENVAPLLARFAEPGADLPALTATLLPRPGDAARAFRPDIALAVEDAYRELIDADPAIISPRPDQRRVEVHACPAGLLGDDNPLSAPFPAGYRALAPYLVAERIWVAWRYTAPDAPRGMAYDGLVWLDDRWVWFPKPNRVVGRLVA